jgi:hypothetical protein
MAQAVPSMCARHSMDSLRSPQVLCPHNGAAKAEAKSRRDAGVTKIGASGMWSRRDDVPSQIARLEYDSYEASERALT